VARSPVSGWRSGASRSRADRRPARLPSLAIIKRLREEGAEVVGFDPTVHEPLDGIGFSADPYGACEGAAVLAVLTDWEEFRWLDLSKVADLMTSRRSSTPATSSIATRCAVSASSTSGSAVEPPAPS
jgi:UDP-N-acetyl-D-mannosaminuronate dehydrogenase